MIWKNFAGAILATLGTLSLTACSGSGDPETTVAGGGRGGTECGFLTLSITDAPVDDAAEEASEELAEAAGDLQECREDVQDCSGGFINREPVECIRDFNQCVDRAYQDAAQACNIFTKRIEDALDDALRKARRSNQRVERRVQSLLANRLREECFAEAVAISRRCARRLQD